MISLSTRKKIAAPRINASNQANGMTAAEKTRAIVAGTAVVIMGAMVAIVLTRRKPNLMEV